jgi:glycosyltransferase involved in cell wall biosynthesis
VVHPGIPPVQVDRASARSAVSRTIGCPPEAEVVVLAARLCPPKGQLDLLEIAPRLIAERPGLHIALLGGETWPYPDHESILRKRARALGVAERVSFVGHLAAGDGAVDDVQRFLSGCDLLVAPSRYEPGSGWREGFGLAPLEAMSVNTPVVAYRHGAFPEILGDCARLVPEGDRKALAEAIVRVLSDDELRAQMIACGAERVRRYRPEDSIAGMERVYEEVSGRA